MLSLKNLTPRNPLAIIALFISLVYGVAVYLITTAVEHLTTENQDRLIWFIVGFPFVILGSFLYLVTKHHTKLYGPGDFRNDASYLKNNARPEEVGKKFIDEASEVSDARPLNKLPAKRGNRASKSKLVAGSPSKPAIEEAEAAADAPMIRGSHSAPNAFAGFQRFYEDGSKLQPSDLYMLEGLVFQELQSELGLPIEREVHLALSSGRVLHLDGMAKSRNSTTLIEVKVIHRAGSIGEALRSATQRLEWFVAELASQEFPPARGMVAIVALTDVAYQTAATFISLRSSSRAKIEIRVFKSADLLERYGFSAPASVSAPE